MEYGTDSTVSKLIAENDFLARVYRRGHSDKSVLLNQNVIKRFNQFCMEVLKKEPKLTIESMQKGQLDPYKVLDAFVQWLDIRASASSISVYFTILKNYLRYHDIEIFNEKCRQKVVLPRIRETRDGELDITKVQRILGVFPEKWRVLFLMELSSLVRPGELLRLRVRDIDFDAKPTRLHVNAEISKNRVQRTTYLTGETTQALKDFLGRRISNPDSFIFGQYRSLQVAESTSAYAFRYHMRKLPDLNKRIEGTRRYEYHIYSFKKYGFTIVSDLAGKDFADFLKGDKNPSSMYYRLPQDKRERKYLELEPFLTIQNADKLQNEYKQTVESLKERVKQLEKEKETLGSKLKSEIKNEIVAELFEKGMKAAEENSPMRAMTLVITADRLKKIFKEE